MSKEKATEGQIRERKYMFTLGPLALKPCKDNPRNKYHSYDLVFDNGMLESTHT